MVEAIAVVGLLVGFVGLLEIAHRIENPKPFSGPVDVGYSKPKSQQDRPYLWKIENSRG